MAKHPVLIVAALLFALIAGCQSPFNPLGTIERSLVFAPSRYPAGDWQPPGLAYEDAWFTAKDGTRLHGWYVPRERRGRSCSSATATAATWPFGPTSCGFCTIAWA